MRLRSRLGWKLKSKDSRVLTRVSREVSNWARTRRASAPGIFLAEQAVEGFQGGELLAFHLVKDAIEDFQGGRPA